MKEKKIKIEKKGDILLVCGKGDENLKLIEKELKVEFVLRDNFLKIKGEEEEIREAEEVIKEILSQTHKGYTPSKKELKVSLKRIKQGEEGLSEEVSSPVIFTTLHGRKIKP
ncbi:MAG: hypothetical protein U9R03_02155, partial [Candidatus Aerophobetes bacterium]|nr:hypothetical protein [Candidatus Aerophobetes bacterium]